MCVSVYVCTCTCVRVYVCMCRGVGRIFKGGGGGFGSKKKNMALLHMCIIFIKRMSKFVLLSSRYTLRM